MSFYHQNLEAFLKLLEEQPQLFNNLHRQDLIDLIEPLPDDIETLSIAIASWYENYDDIVDAQLEILNSAILINNDSEKTSTSELALARLPLTNISSVPKPKLELNKETLKNAIQPLSKTTPPQ
ncbi:MAG: hypothetical protein ACRC78_13275 [Planktothrix sp.]